MNTNNTTYRLLCSESSRFFNLTPYPISIFCLGNHVLSQGSGKVADADESTNVGQRRRGRNCAEQPGENPDVLGRWESRCEGGTVSVVPSPGMGVAVVPASSCTCFGRTFLQHLFSIAASSAARMLDVPTRGRGFFYLWFPWVVLSLIAPSLSYGSF